MKARFTARTLSTCPRPPPPLSRAPRVHHHACSSRVTGHQCRPWFINPRRLSRIMTTAKTLPRTTVDRAVPMLNSSVLRFRQLSSCLIGSKAGLEIRSRRINVHSAMHTSGVTLSIIDFSSGKFLVSRRLIHLVIDNVRSVCINYWFEKNKRRSVSFGWIAI